jgi:hypothetical protein
VTADADAGEAKAIIEDVRRESSKAAAYRSYLAQVAELSSDPARRLAAQEVLDRPALGDPYHEYLQRMAGEHPDPAVRARASDVLNTID